jgi:hypothetical protein
MLVLRAEQTISGAIDMYMSMCILSRLMDRIGSIKGNGFSIIRL